MYILNVDLDNTLIYSYKHDIGLDTMEVELYEGRNISYMTKKTCEYLSYLSDKLMIVPTTTRTMEQYQRIHMPIPPYKYALVCNGGILLVDGCEDEEWYMQSLELVKESQTDLRNGMEFLEKDSRRTFEVRYIRDLFVFTKCEEPEKVVSELKNHLDTERVNVFNNGIKVYIVPKNLSKGHAMNRFNRYIGGDNTVLAAGDSEFDISMLQKADIAYAPYCLKDNLAGEDNVNIIPENQLFSEGFLSEICKIVE